MGSSLELAFLGPLEVTVDGRGPAALGGRRQRALLVVLALHAGQVVSCDRLVDQLWGEDPPAQPLHTVQVFVSRLRRALGEAGERLVTRQPGYVLDLETDALDAERYEHLYARARAAMAAGAPDQAAALLREADTLWRGAPLSEFSYEPFAQATIARLEELHASCREELIEAELALGRHAEVLPTLEAVVREQPFRERLRGQLMLALYRCGRQADALESFQHARRALLDELGVEPSRELRALEQAILQQDPSLQAPAPDRGASAPAAARRASVAPPSPRSDGPRAASAETSASGGDPVGAAREASEIPAGAPLDPAGTATARLMRKTVTVVAVRVQPASGADPETARGAVATARRAIETTVGRHGGVVASGLGGEIVTVFGLPLVREDDVLRALRAADELHGDIPAHADARGALTVRVGVDTGEVVAEDVGDLFGAPLDGAIARAREAADESVVMSEAAHALAANTIEAVPGRGGWLLRGFSSEASLAPRGGGGAMIGRDDDLRAARAAFDRAASAGQAHLLTVIGDPGIGKSRLLRELAAEIGDGATMLAGNCLSYGEGVAFWPLREAFTDAAGAESPAAIRALLGDGPDADVVAGIIAAAVGLTASESVGEQLPWAFRRALEILAAERPVMLVVDDAHWASTPLLDLVDHLVDWLMAPVLVLCLGRPELLEARPRWGGGHARMTSLVLAPLSHDDARRLLESRCGDAPLGRDLTTQILDTAEGNPLFVEQLLAMSAEDPRWYGRADIPATMHSLLAARLDRLGPGERAYIECAAIIGREFWPAAIIELLPGEARAAADQHLRALVRRGLVRPERSTLAGEQALRFHHILIRDVAYRSTPKAVRGALHERFADWLVGRVEGVEEIIGYHLEQAVRLRSELTGPSEEVIALAQRATHALAAAGRRALARGETNAGIALLERAAALGAEAGTADPAVLLDLGSARLESGEFAAAEEALEAALVLARQVRAEGLAARTLIELSYLRALVDPAAKIADMQAVADEAMTVFKRLGDEGGLSRAWLHVAEIHWTRLRCAEMEVVLERALRHADIAGDRRERSRIMRDLARATVIGPRPVPDGIARCTSLLERAGDDVSLTAVAETMLAVLEAMAGRFDIARELCETGRRRLDDVGLTITAAVLRMYRAFIEVLADAPRRAVPDLVEACTVLERIGERRRLATTAALLARLLYADGRYDDAQRLSDTSQGAASNDDVVSLVIVKGTLGRLAARAGAPERALGFSDEAVALAARTDFLALHGDALAERAEVLSLLDRPERAIDDWEAAVALYERKGSVAAAKRARAAQSAIVAPLS